MILFDVSHCGCLCVCTAFAHFAKDTQVVITSVLGQDTAMWRESINERRMEKGKCVCVHHHNSTLCTQHIHAHTRSIAGKDVL